MTVIKQIIADEAIPYVQDYFGSLGELVLVNGRAITKEVVKTADILLVRAVTQVDAQLLAGTAVRFVGTVTAGEDHLDQAWLRQAGIAFANAAGCNAPAVADYVTAVIALLQRQNRLPVQNARAAIIGCGHVGQQVAARLAALNIACVYCDPLRAETEDDFVHTALEAIQDVDLITLHVPLTQSGAHATHRFIDKAFLARQKPHAVLINTSRGAVIHTADLWQYGRHLTWCFDVWDNEPSIDLAMMAVTTIATPHIAGYAIQAKMRGILQIYQAAHQLGFIKPSSPPAINMPTQTLTFAGANLHWQDIVLGIFNPLTATTMMRAACLEAKTPAQAFDQLRRAFTHRHEFAYTTVQVSSLLPEDQTVLEGLGVEVVQRVS